MREDTFRRKKASRLFKDIGGRGWLAGRMAEILCQGKRGLDGLSLELGGMVAEAIMYMEREEMGGPDYHPYCSQIQKWASQRGSIFVGDRKLGVEHPWLRGPDGEVVFRTYGKLKDSNGFSEELLGKALRERLGSGLIHQRCTIHKDRNIQKHLAKSMEERSSSAFSYSFGAEQLR